MDVYEAHQFSAGQFLDSLNREIKLSEEEGRERGNLAESPRPSLPSQKLKHKHTK
jgi:hypothetical protein